jgi:16S rRNA A1518/A1519 N6-dimethyltransferase RsmA/KsgA/DIM1 with predicted DNA glycosylase/AP lyase activity
MIFLTIFFIVLLPFLLIILFCVWTPESPWSPWWRTNKKTAEAVCDLAKISAKDVVYELGSGDGEALITIARKTGAQCVGIEIDPFRFLFSQIRKISSHTKNIQFVRRDFKKMDLKKATIVYMYLVPAGIKRTLPLFKKDLQPGTKLVSYIYKIPLEKKDSYIQLQKEDKENNLFIYTIIRG